MRATRIGAAVSALALLLAACTSGTTSTTSTTGAVAGGSSDSSAASVVTDDPALDALLPVDPDVMIGVLDNGLTYYLRHNDSPGGRVEMRLLVNVGSIQEDPDQSGMAHFLEHMMFNGTERFPRNELIAVLESFGPRFGPDINAFTSFDETVYELSLVADDDLVDLGVVVLREWAGRATLTETDVHEERGVVLDEWRLRTQGFGGRIGDSFQDLILPGTSYFNHLPIGTPESIESAEPETLRRFYEDWYRPELMAVVVVGDFELGEMEDRIFDAFDDLEDRGLAREREPSEYTPSQASRSGHLADEEAGGASVTLTWPGVSEPLTTVGDFQSAIALAIALDIFASRLNDDALEGEAPLLGASELNFDYTRAISLVGIDVQTRPEQVEDALRALLTEAKRVNEFGFTNNEFDRALSRFEAASDQRRQQQETAQDVFFADQIMAHHLAGAHLMSAEQRFEAEAGVLQRLTRSQVEAAFSARAALGPHVLAVGPDDADPAIPDGTRIDEVIDEVAASTVVERDDRGTTAEALMATPEPASVVSKEIDTEFGYTTLNFENGATVFLWPSSIAEGGVFALVESFGGTSQVAIEDLAETFLMADILARSGVGPADALTLERLLADRLVQVFPWITETREGITGNAASDDVEALFQLIHLYMSAPRFDPVAVEAVLDEMAALDAARGDIPSILFDEAANEGYYGDDPRYFVFPTSDQLVDFDVTAMADVYRERFGDAGDFAFAFVGDFEVDEMTDLAARYIGTLPGDADRESWVDNQPLPPRRIQTLTVEAGADPQGQVGLFFTNELDPTLDDRLGARLLELIVDARLRDRIREQLSATYSIRSGIDLQRDPDAFVEALIISTGDPNDLGRISDEVMDDLIDLQENGPTEEQFNTALEQLRTEMDLIDNGTLARALTTSFLYPDQPVEEIRLRFGLIDEITPEDVRDLARIAFNPDQRIEVRQGPRLTGTGT